MLLHLALDDWATSRKLQLGHHALDGEADDRERNSRVAMPKRNFCASWFVPKSYDGPAKSSRRVDLYQGTIVNFGISFKGVLDTCIAPLLRFTSIAVQRAEFGG
jgi:hypothetical protein